MTERTNEGADVTGLAMLLHDHRPERLLPPPLVSGCKCGWGSEVFAHSAHQANEVAKYLERTAPPAHPNPEPPTGDGGREGVGS